MAWYYVKSGGTATGDAGRATTERTTSFTTMGASAYYDDVAEVINKVTPTTDIVGGDTISCSDLHAASTSGNVQWTFLASSIVIIQSVDDTAANVLKAGARETFTSNGTLTFATTLAHGFFYGMELYHANDLQVNASNSRWRFRNCVLSADGNGDIIWRTNQDGVVASFKDCTFNAESHAGVLVFRLSNGMFVEIIGGTTSGSAITNFLETNSPPDGGAQLYVTGFDYTNCSATANLTPMGGVAGDDSCIARLHNCKTLSGQTLFETPSELGSFRHMEATGTDDTDAFRYEFKTNYGQVLHSTSTYVTSDTAIEGSTNYSYQINTTTNCSKTTPFRWMLPVGYEDLSVASTDTVRVRITSATSLTQEEVAIFIGTSNTTNNTEMDLLSTIETKVGSSTWIPDYTATGGTALATDASQWTNAQTNEYAITVTPTSVDATSPLAPTIWIEAYTDTTFFVSSQLVFEA